MEGTMINDEKQKLITILEAIGDEVYVIDHDFNVEYMNEVMINKFGQGIKRKCYQVIQGKEEVCEWCKAKDVFGGKSIRWEHYIKNLDLTYDVIEFPLKSSDGTISKVSVFRDITERKKSEEMIRTSEEDYKRLFENVRSGLYVSSKEGKFLNANKALLDMLSYKSNEEFLKIDITKDLYHRPENRRKFQEMVERDGHVIDYEVDFKRKDGSSIPVSLTGHARYDQQGKVLGYEGINVDLSLRKQMERKLVETQEKLLQSEKLAAMGRLTSQIAHELNNPLYGIMNTLELLKTEVSPQSKRRKILDMALSETERLTDLLRKMLSFSKPDEEKKQPTDINTILDEILLLVRKQLQENSIRISSSLVDDQLMVYASRNQLRQVFLNMISNAMDAMPEGGTLSVKTMSKGDNVYIEIADTGIGIREDDIHQIFVTFFTTKDSV